VAHSSNLGYSGDRDQEYHGSKPTWAQFERPYLKNRTQRPYTERRKRERERARERERERERETHDSFLEHLVREAVLVWHAEENKLLQKLS
jgi:hypothetical protein